MMSSRWWALARIVKSKRPVSDDDVTGGLALLPGREESADSVLSQVSLSLTCSSLSLSFSLASALRVRDKFVH